MHNNYYFLKHLTNSLTPQLNNAELVECFTQNKNELIFAFAGKDDIYIKAHLSPAFCCLSLPNNFSRARKNSVDLFEDIISKKVTGIRMFLNERCFALQFTEGYQLLFKMHGNRSNIILFKEETIIEIFKKGLKNDFDININELDRSIGQSYDHFIKEEGNFKKLFPTFGPVIKDYFKSINYDSLTTEQKWEAIQTVLKQLESPDFHITEINEKLTLSLIYTGNVIEEFNDPVEALNHFFIKYISDESIRQLKKQLLSDIEKNIRKSEGYIKKTGDKLKGIEQNQNYSQLADIIMANLHNISPRSTEATLDNFYDNNSPISIKLKRDLSPQKNAENYYRKAKNQALEVKALKKNLAQKEDLLLELMLKKENIESTEDLKTLKGLTKQNNSEKNEQQPKPFMSFVYNNWHLWVGKNARNNDLLLQQYAYKDDLWLHAKDVSGSHVLIKHQAGKSFPQHVIEKAAQLAAYYSKRKNDTLCPVIVTPRKFVRKRKGDPAGMVAVDKEESVILVPPSNEL
ncbi:NFACT RNA binding domain-containing protein [Fulvivirga maritima]|uniref:NFACT RNA binding domain-containing protein n=1 Tax=Fulvivirga maritima TaxID=2904247 RepID=UPI001F3CDB26|nr:NFACT RNA binding domain-containing protein [Fulvivirga maritima]UII29442.1 NFACT RNA binding domain-containing protein [Fulvivirga maritima]